MASHRQYVAIDLKSFYASVECVERGLNPLDACLVVADESRTEKTICLAVSPALKAFGLPGRPRLFEVVQRVKEVNARRGHAGVSTSGNELSSRRDLAVGYIVASPRMQLYVDYSTRVYDIYLRHVAAEDIHVYSIDEVIIDVTAYLETYRMTAHDLAMRMIRDVLAETGITATAGIGTNMYLCKIAMDIVAKKMPPDRDGVRIAELDEISYRRKLWTHVPLTDFWRTGRGIARRLERAGLYTMGDVARASLICEEWFYKEFGVNAELLIDHAWGWEPVTMDLVKAYHPETRSISSGQVLQCAYTFEKALTVIKEMADSVALELVEKRLVTNQIVLTVGYDVENLTDSSLRGRYHGKITTDYYGREVPMHAHGTINLERYTSSSKLIIKEVIKKFDEIVNRNLLVKRINISASNVLYEYKVKYMIYHQQLNLFTNHQNINQKYEKESLEKEKNLQKATLKIKQKYGKNAILKGMNLEEGATTRERNEIIGGHKA